LEGFMTKQQVKDVCLYYYRKLFTKDQLGSIARGEFTFTYSKDKTLVVNII